MFELCAELGGMTVAEMLERMSSREITYWKMVYIIRAEEAEAARARRS